MWMWTHKLPTFVHFLPFHKQKNVGRNYFGLLRCTFGDPMIPEQSEMTTVALESNINHILRTGVLVSMTAAATTTKTNATTTTTTTTATTATATAAIATVNTAFASSTISTTTFAPTVLSMTTLFFALQCFRAPRISQKTLINRIVKKWLPAIGRF